MEATLASLAHTRALARLIARRTTGSDVLCLLGEMGTGKTAFSRCFVQEYLNDPTVQVTSPTYLLDLHYDSPAKPGITVRHLDLFRFTGPDDLRSLGLVPPQATTPPPRISLSRDEIALIEWPQRVGMESMPHDRLDLHFLIFDDAHTSPKSYRRTAVATSTSGDEADNDDEEEEESEQRLVQLCGHGHWRARLPHVQREWHRYHASADANAI